MRCFVIMPYGNLSENPERKRDLDLFYHELIKPAVESVPLPGTVGEYVKCHRADKEPRPGEIVMHIIENLVLSEIAIADVTGRNPNVFYELGVRHAVSDNTILLAQGEEDIPMDLRGQRYFIYRRDFQGGVRLRDALVRAVEEIVRSPKKIDNPVCSINSKRGSRTRGHFRVTTPFKNCCSKCPTFGRILKRNSVRSNHC